MQTQPLHGANIGTAARSNYLYGHLMQTMPGVELVAVRGRSSDSARASAAAGAFAGVTRFCSTI